MKTATDILQERILSYNETVSDFSKIRFTSKELGIFTGGMEEYASQFHPSPKEISEEEIEGLFLAKYGNKITASDSWVIRFALDCVRKSSLPSSCSKTEAVEFAEWLNRYFIMGHNRTYQMYWLKSDYFHHLPEFKDKNATIQECYQLFLKDKQQ